MANPLPSFLSLLTLLQVSVMSFYRVETLVKDICNYIWTRQYQS